MPDDMPDNVHLMAFDEIFVEHRKPSMRAHLNSIGSFSFADDPYCASFRKLLLDADHTDVVFIVGPERTQIPAHKAILAARCEYFRCMFKRDGMMESLNGVISVPDHQAHTFRCMLEFLYSNSIRDLESYDADEIIELISLSSKYLIDVLKEVLIKAASKQFEDNNIGKFLLFAEMLGDVDLKRACGLYIRRHISSVKLNPNLRSKIVENPELALAIVDALPDEVPCSKKRKYYPNDDDVESSTTVDSDSLFRIDNRI